MATVAKLLVSLSSLLLPLFPLANVSSRLLDAALAKVSKRSLVTLFESALLLVVPIDLLERVLLGRYIWWSYSPGIKTSDKSLY